MIVVNEPRVPIEDEARGLERSREVSARGTARELLCTFLRVTPVTTERAAGPPLGGPQRTPRALAFLVVNYCNIG